MVSERIFQPPERREPPASIECYGRRDGFHLQALLSMFLNDDNLLNSPRKADRDRIRFLIRFLESGEASLTKGEIEVALLILKNSLEKTLKEAATTEKGFSPIDEDYFKVFIVLVLDIKTRITQALYSLGKPISLRDEVASSEA